MANVKKPQNKSKEVVKEVKDEEKKMSTQTLLMIASAVLVLIFISAYIYKWQKIKNEEKYMTSYLLNSGTVSLEIKNLEEVSQILKESPTEYFVLITYTNDKDTYELETGIKKVIDDYKLSDSFYYLNIENIKSEDNYLARINNAFDTDKIKNVPIILYYKDGKIVDFVKRDDNNCINAGDFQKLLDIYEYKGQ